MVAVQATWTRASQIRSGLRACCGPTSSA